MTGKLRELEWERREAIVQALHRGLRAQGKRGGDPLPAWLSVSELTDEIVAALASHTARRQEEAND